MDTSSSCGPVRRLVHAGVCGALFFAAYGYCTFRTAGLADVPTGFVRWDHAIPFMPWTIVPYWSLDLLFVTSFLIQKRAENLRTHTARIILGIAIACAGFLLFPLRADAGTLPDAGIWTPWFRTLSLFDKPFNQAPSLHIILLLIVWRAHLPALPANRRPAGYLWGALIAVSTVTTRQHGLIDLLAGAAVGVVIVALIRPERVFLRETRATPRLVVRYGAGAVAALCASYLFSDDSLPVAWAFAWLATASGLVALAYSPGSPRIYEKRNGRVHWSSFFLLAPVLIPQRLIHRRLAKKNVVAEIAPDVSFGSVFGKIPEDVAVVDLTAEHTFPAAKVAGYAGVPILDLSGPDVRRIDEAVGEIERLRAHGPVRIVCALGLSRSATVAAAWLLRTGRATDAADAESRIRAARPDALPHLPRR